MSKSYALRRTDSCDVGASKCALRGRHIFSRVAMETEHDTFLQTLFYRLVLDQSLPRNHLLELVEDNAKDYGSYFSGVFAE